MLARCTEQVLSSSGGDDALVDACMRMSMNSSSRRRRNDEKEDLSVRGALDALQGILQRADEDPSAQAENGATAAVWVKVLTVAKRALRKRNEERLGRTALFARWLLAREAGEEVKS